MGRVRRVLILLATLTLVAAGAGMPFAASRLQDARQAAPELRSFDSFSLTLRQEADLGRTLKLVAASDYYIKEAEQGEDARMTQAEVLTAGEELIKELTQFGLLDRTISSPPDVWPQILCTNDDLVSIPTWTLQWDLPDEASGFYVWLDDAAGKAFMISAPCRRYSKDYIFNAGSEPVYAQAENWRVFLEEYYGTGVQLADAEWFSYAARFELTFSLGEEEAFRMDLYIYFEDGFTSLSPHVDAGNKAGTYDG